MRRGNYFNLVREFTITDFKLRYQGSFLGVLWSFLRPLAMFGTLYLVFSKFARFDIPAYQFYLLLGVLMWNFFNEATSSSMMSLVSRSGLLKKINFNKTIIIVSSVGVAFINFLLGFTVFVAILGFVKGIQLFPIFITFLLSFNLFLVGLGVGFFLSALNSRFKDISHLWEILIQMGFWITPIVYSPSMVPARYHLLLLGNPIFQIIEHSRNAMLYDQILPGLSLLKISFFSIAVFFIGFFFFRKRQARFAEEL